MTYKDFVKNLSEKIGMSKADTDEVIKEIFGYIESLNSQGENVVIPKFGTFKQVTLKGKMNFSIYKGEYSVKKIKFYQYRSSKDKLNDK